MKKLAALGAFFMVALGTAGCGSSIPGNSVASVAGNPITLAAYNHWIYIYAKDQAAEEAAEEDEAAPSFVLSPNDPPEFKKCIADIRAEYAAYKKTAAKTLKVDCAEVFQQARSVMMPYLIEAYWVQAQAHKQGITVSDATVQAAVNKELDASTETNTTAKAEKYLATLGETIADVTFEVRYQLTSTKLTTAATKPVTDADIAAYYAKNKSKYGTGASARMKMILFKTQAKAQAAYTAIKSGTSWTAAAKKYGDDASSSAYGGSPVTAPLADLDPVLAKKVGKASLNQVSAPLKAEYGYYVFEVSKRNAATQQSLAQATPAIRKTLTANAKTAAEKAVLATITKNWKPKTHCLALYSVAQCSNYNSAKASPAEWSTTQLTSTTTTATTTATSTATTATTGTSTSTTKTSG